MHSKLLFVIVILATCTDLALTQQQIIKIDNKDMALRATPTTVTPGITKSLVIYCSMPKSHTVNGEIFSAFILKHSTDNKNYKMIASYSIKATSNEGRANVFVSGHLVEIAESYIQVDIKDPQNSDSGWYQCIANGVNANGVHVTMDRSTEVALGNGNQPLDSCLLKVKELESSIAILNQSCSPVSFVRETSFGASQYHLSAPVVHLSAEDANEKCKQLKGGYLVEIDSTPEYNHLVNFLRGESQYYAVLTGGSDQKTEGNWIYDRTGAPIRDIQWGPKQPDAARVANCLFFWNNNNQWKMSDEECVMNSNGNHRYGFICEVSR